MSELKKAAEKTEEMTRKIWLAGLGAYGQSMDNLHTGYEKMSEHAREYFEELVSRGEKLENEARSNFRSTGTKIKQQAEKNKDRLNKQISGLKDKVSGHMTMPSLHKDELLEELHSRVSKLTETLNKLLPAKETASAATRAPAKKAPTKKAPVSKASAKKTASKTSVATRTVTKSGSVKKTAAPKPATKRTTARKAPTTRRTAAS